MTLQHHARLVGLRGADLPSLESIERRRLQLWVITSIFVIAVAMIALFGSWQQDVPSPPWFTPTTLRFSVLALSIGFSFYAIEKELHLRRLMRMLISERALSSELSHRVNELTSLIDASKAVNSVLELDEVLRIILRSALDLLKGSDGSIMLLQPEGDLRAACVFGNEHANDVRIPLGAGIAGRVAQVREPLLISGKLDPADFPGAVPRVQRVESAMSVPLVNREELLGVLNCNASVQRVFTEYDLRALSLFAEQAAAAIANARLYERQREHVKTLMEIDQLKTEFISSVSHDLRTPLTAIFGSAKVAMHHDLSDEDRRELLMSIERQAGRLAQMVQQLLDTAELQNQEPFRAAGVVDLARRLRAIASAYTLQGIDLSVDVPSELAVHGEGGALDRVFNNLIENALRYGAQPIVIRARPEGEVVRCEVIDRGAGIPDDQFERIFERFHRGDRARSSSGLGLGLSIVRKIVEAHGGSVWAENEPDGGARLCVTLHAAPAQEERTTGRPAAPEVR
jgi:two-component system sensor histidine kinase KdpD